MSADIRELLPLYAIGALDAGEVALVDQAVASDPALARELASYHDAATSIVAPVAPPPAIKARLMASIGGGPLDRFAARMASMFDVAIDRAREFLGLIERPASWEPGIPGISLVHFIGGPACAEADTGFVRLAPGTTFPRHTHLGEELTLILSGSLRESTTGRTLVAGDEYVMPQDSEHELVCVGSEDCVFAARAINGIAIGGAPVRFR